MIGSLQFTVYSLQPKIRIQRLIFLFIALSSAFCALNAIAQEPISSLDLIERAKELDGTKVVYQGEVIGEVMRRGNFAWINVHDGDTAIGIWAAKDLTEEIEYTGSFKSKGDWVEVQGIFNRACTMHGGEFDIHADKLSKVSSGWVVEDRLVYGKQKLTQVLSAILLGLLLIQLILSIIRRIRKPKPKKEVG